MDIKYPEANLEVKSLTHWLGVRRMDTDLSTPYLGKSTTAKTTLLCYAAISHGYAVFLHTFGNTVCHGDRRHKLKSYENIIKLKFQFKSFSTCKSFQEAFRTHTNVSKCDFNLGHEFSATTP